MRTTTSTKRGLYFKDFFGEERHVTISIRMDISELEKIILPVQT